MFSKINLKFFLIASFLGEKEKHSEKKTTKSGKFHTKTKFEITVLTERKALSPRSPRGDFPFHMKRKPYRADSYKMASLDMKSTMFTYRVYRSISMEDSHISGSAERFVYFVNLVFG